MNRLDRRIINWIFESAFMVVLFALSGKFLDQKLGTEPNIMSLGILFGFGIQGWNFYQIYRDLIDKTGQKKE